MLAGSKNTDPATLTLTVSYICFVCCNLNSLSPFQLVSGQHLTDSQPSLPTVEIQVIMWGVTLSLMLAHIWLFVDQILDATGETCRGKLQASSCSDNYTHWESGAVVSTDIVFVPYSTIKFTVYSEKPMSEYHSRPVQGV